MNSWKSKLFGDNRMNFFGWIGAGLLVMAVSLWLFCQAITAESIQSPICLLLGAIYFVLVGHFGLALQNYCARVAKAIESEDAKAEEEESEDIFV